MATKELDDAEQSFEAVMKGVLKDLPPEKRAGFLEARDPDRAERLAGLAPAERLAGLGAGQILDALSPEVRAALAEKLKH